MSDTEWRMQTHPYTFPLLTRSTLIFLKSQNLLEVWEGLTKLFEVTPHAITLSQSHDKWMEICRSRKERLTWVFRSYILNGVNGMSSIKSDLEGTWGNLAHSELSRMNNLTINWLPFRFFLYPISTQSLAKRHERYEDMKKAVASQFCDVRLSDFIVLIWTKIEDSSDLELFSRRFQMTHKLLHQNLLSEEIIFCIWSYAYLALWSHILRQINWVTTN